MTLLDDRTEEEQRTHRYLVGGHDKAMSGWGRCPNGKSYAYWACREKDAEAVEKWVRGRGDIKRVSRTRNLSRKGRLDHVHIYAVKPTHVAL